MNKNMLSCCFFFSSRRRHTRWPRDWSSDVCSSDLIGRAEEGRLSFKNELHRAYVYYAMGKDRRRYHHAQLAQRLAGSQDRNHLQPMLELAHHFICAGMQHQAMETALQAAEVAIARGAPREAERVLTRLLRTYAVTPDSKLRLVLAL